MVQKVFSKEALALAELPITVAGFGGVSVCGFMVNYIWHCVFVHASLPPDVSITAFFTATSPTEAAGDGFQL